MILMTNKTEFGNPIMRKTVLLLVASAFVTASAIAQRSEDPKKAGAAVIEGAKTLFGDCLNRYQGSDGNLRASEKIDQYFEKAGVQCGFTTYESPCFVPGSFEMMVEGRKIVLHPMIPNYTELGNFKKPNFSGRVVYVGEGDVAELEKRDLRDTLCLFDFNCGRKYMRVMKYGAAGCLFIEPDQYYRAMGEDKVVNIPFTIPRFQVSREDGEFLKKRIADSKKELEFTMKSSPNKWKFGALRNHWALVEGTDPEWKKQMIIIHAKLDTLCYCPGLVSGGQDTANLKVMLDLFDHFRKNPPKRSILFMALNSTYQLQKGTSEIVAHLFGRETDFFLSKSESEAGGRHDCEEGVVEDIRETSNYLLKQYDKVAPDKVNTKVIQDFAAVQEIIASKNTKPSDIIVHLIEFDISQYEDKVLRIIRAGEKEERKAEIKKYHEKIIELGNIVCMFNKFGDTKTWSEMTEKQKELFESYRQVIIDKAENSLKRCAVLERRLEDVKNTRELFKTKGMVPILALGLDISYGNEWFALTGPGLALRLGRLSRQLGHLFINRANFLGSETTKPYGLRWKSLNKKERIADFAAAEFTKVRVPGYGFYSPGDRRLSALSEKDKLERLDPEMVGRKFLFLKDYLRVVLDDEKTGSNLADIEDGKISSRLQWHVGVSGVMETRVNDGTSLGLPETVLPHGIIAIGGEPRWDWGMRFFHQYSICPSYFFRFAMSDVAGRASFYNLLQGGKYALECYHYDEKGQLDHALDKGDIMLKYDPILMSKSGYVPFHAVNTMECRKADLYDLLAPRTLEPVDKPKFFTAQDGRIIQFSFLGTLRNAGNVSIFAHPEQAMKVLFSGDVNLINATPEKPTGIGYTIPELDREYVPKLVGKDVYQLNDERIRLLNKNAVTNSLMDRFHKRSGDYLGVDSKVTDRDLVSQGGFLVYLNRVLKGYGCSSNAYRIVKSTLTDMMKAVVFYLAVLIPFCFFLQKLLFKFVRIEAQIGCFAGIFIVSYLVFYNVHPAFRLAKNPQVILMAFVTLTLALFVSFALKGKFDYHMAAIKERFLGEEDANFLKLCGTAMVIGVTNMKRRFFRTMLTCFTVMLITFTMLSFTSVSQSVDPTRVLESETSPYNGVFCCSQNWLPLSEPKVEFFENVLGRGLDSIKRGFLCEMDTALPVLAPNVERELVFRNLLAVEKREDGWLAPMPLVAGRFFSSDTAMETVITDVFAENALNLDLSASNPIPDDFVLKIDGVPLKVVGIVDSEKLRQIRDLRNVSIYPKEPTLDASNRQTLLSKSDDDKKEGEKKAPDNAYSDTDPAFFSIVPLGIRTAFNIPVTSVSIRCPDAQTAWNRSLDFVYYSNDRLYFGTTKRYMLNPDRKPEEKALYSAGGIYFLGKGFASSIGGLGALIIPLLVSATIIFNTMLGTVYERKKEIAIFNAIGLNPIHVAIFFVAEAVVFGMLGGVGGYLIGQLLAKVIVSLNLLPGLNLNYSSLSVVYVILFTMFVVLLSTIYPACMAMRTAGSSSGRKRIEKSTENSLQVLFPFSFTHDMAVAANAYLREYFDKHRDATIGNFTAEELAVDVKEVEGESLNLELKYDAALAPYDLGVTQIVHLKTQFNAKVGAFMVEAITERKSGMDKHWLGTNKVFLNDIRKYLLHWRALPQEGRQSYMEQGTEMFLGKKAAAESTT